MKAYTIIAGVNGVGKSSLTGVLKAERNDLGCVIIVTKRIYSIMKMDLSRSASIRTGN